MNLILKFVKHESFGGVLLVISTVLALIFQNGFLSEFYSEILRAEFSIGFRDFNLSKPLILWVNDGLMAIFFFVVGLELKREMVDGELSKPSQIALPTIAALGGVIFPALIFWFFNHSNEFAIRGWAIPTATDIAFALGVLLLLGKRVPSSLKIFLLTLAIIDDLCAIIIIALFYTSTLSFSAFLMVIICLFALGVLNYFKVGIKSIYILITIVLWLSVLKSGVHATIAGVVAAFFVPLKDKDGRNFLEELEHDWHGITSYIILPVFAFVNAGVGLSGVHINQLLNSVSLGIFFGLFIGKQVGVFLFSFIFIKLGFGKLPEGSTWKQFYGVCILTGIGFTMSLFVDSLAYNDSAAFFHADKLAILLASFTAGVIGFIYLYIFSKKIKD
ncbi:Na+/H+ antiporter NhaA [Campylobacter hyointestinalis]|uniref:Na(+)/H(+) antiporter NhaA n=1 Tax=Campylobacter hyointestinalis subsp. hyointestinalis TaxID=91352 RepID=A0A0S4SPB9_CAMHY|nr:Na+/H+ antiporter NhaA [Campylobacter hyointestinalis]PPB53438.1 Na+/H+ antiporter NhaA [Campylobacter hyointestinalis subsp. hyointestinalis]PPB54545.1 Na+/H+ antiporter NhaA [Campylobacter hyointestinalis subsp. hyointestinalis]PPB61043.1 Na+/H+ antiporter NhaA [Campylobacter hyointestinalis subsp. hyointestinalis]PPB65525.1 Na+/H+ antiporter NhaA [Campylobacter hyointestinalis subsp. hyointestinalis]PPB66337.1 Na+/H+ antiporter NhaA [Campylobacter hyointestinalis subsp. hyointestinalis]